LAGVFYFKEANILNPSTILFYNEENIRSWHKIRHCLIFVYLADMQFYTKGSDLRSLIHHEKSTGKSIAFIPTMGALHEGHLSLIDIGKGNADLTVCSIYVNPKQFNNADDLNKYPRTLEHDRLLLIKAKCDILFAPSTKEVYPAGLNTEININLNNLDEVMEGRFRPGHFKGMLQVVKRLLDVVEPDYLIMGQKDFQQFTLVNQMIKQLNLPVKLVIGPTLREKDGLAMSSRNRRLDPNSRKKSVMIYKCLNDLKNQLSNYNVEIIQQNAFEELKNTGLEPEYVEIVDGNNLKKIHDPDHHDYIVACIAAWVGDVRLIDNLILKGSLN
jgi:pantoate--beta-alanine ligase